MNNTIEELVKFEMKNIEQSFVPDPQDKENLHITTNVDEWLELVNNRKTDFLTPSEYILDYEIIKNASGYILGPVFKYGTKAESAASIDFNSLQEMKDFLNDKKYLLYYIITYIKSAEFDKESFTFKPLKEPVIRHTFRGHILG